MAAPEARYRAFCRERLHLREGDRHQATIKDTNNIEEQVTHKTTREPVWPGGKALGW